MFGAITFLSLVTNIKVLPSIIVRIVVTSTWQWLFFILLCMFIIVIIVINKWTSSFFIANLLLKQVTSVLIYLIHFLLINFAVALKHFWVRLWLFKSILRSWCRFFNILINWGHLSFSFLIFDHEILCINIVPILSKVGRTHTDSHVWRFDSF